MKKHIIRIVELTTYISFGTLIACGIWYLVTLVSMDMPIMTAEIQYITLWEIPLLGFLCAIGSDIAMTCSPDITAAQATIRIILHYIYINTVVLVCGYFFEWYELNIWGVLLMLLTSAVIYGFTYFFTYFRTVHTADKLNRKLKDYRKNK